MQVLTAGYQRETIEAFVEKVKSADVDVVVDVRTRPYSRKPGFSKESLRQHLEKVGIDYRHVVSLGMPVDLLKHRSGDNAHILSAYRDQLPQHETLLKALVALASRKRICLLCFEENEDHCHRSVLADYLANTDAKIQITHLPPATRSPVADSRRR